MTAEFSRLQLLYGPEALERLRAAKVIVFGVGGVGSWCAEALARCAIGHITIVDSDKVDPSNINRQLVALESTVGRAKVDVMARRIADINPDCRIVTVEGRYTPDTAPDFALETYDAVVDAIDSLADKALLIHNATRARRPRLFSSMGAALKLDPTRIRTAEFSRVTGCRLAAALRRKFKKSALSPARKFPCVYSDELLPNRGALPDASDGSMTYGKVAVNGSLCHITAIFGLTLAGLIVRAIAAKAD